ncbi:MAG: hypothetical protein OXH75_25440 [Acidobacteria bacterium]|nr:hypothetical protein [Acidobacteriota bacterium]
MSRTLSRDLLERFGGNCCIEVGSDPAFWRSFLLEVAKELAGRKFVARVPDGRGEAVALPPKVAMMRDVTYRGAPSRLDPGSSDWGQWMEHARGDALDQMFKKHDAYAHQDEFKFVWTPFDDDDVREWHHHWRFTAEDIDTGSRHELIEALEDDADAPWIWDVVLPKVKVRVSPPPDAIKPTLR